VLAEGCAKAVRHVEVPSGSHANVAELWVEPARLDERNLLHGPGGASLRPDETTFSFVAEDKSGWSPGFDVRDREGISWSVKLGPEAQTEVVVSRILWALGYHQPPTYYLERWTLDGGPGGTQPPARFRPDLPGHEVVGEWSWYENPFVDSQPFRGLVVANLLLNSWDWKTSNNKIYKLERPANGVTRHFVVRDLGASLGRTTYPTILKWFRLRGFGQGTRNDIAGFETQGFIREVDDEGGVTFDYRGIYRDVIDTVTADDVRWACALMSKLTDRQWRDAFAAAGYDEALARRFIAKIKEKIAQGLEVTAGRAAARSGSAD
jgi:hypothetical protein